MASFWSLSFLAVFLTLNVVNCEQFTALVDLQHLVYREREMKTALKDYIALEETRLSVLKNFLGNVEKAHSSILDDNIEGFLGHPVNSYVLIKRFYNEWPNMEKTIQHDNSEGRVKILFMNERFLNIKLC